MPENETIFIKGSEASKRIGVNRRTITRWVRDGVLPGRIISGTCLVYRRAVEELCSEPEAA